MASKPAAFVLVQLLLHSCADAFAPPPPPPCMKQGDHCSLSKDCCKELVCQIDNQMYTCEPKSPLPGCGAEGDHCSLSDVCCKGLSCNTSKKFGSICEQQCMKEGDRCLLQDDCCEGLHCHTSNQTSTCEPSAAAGHARPDPTLFFKVAKESAAVSFAKPIPHISEQFIVKTTEIDNGTVIVRQTLIWDVENQRSHMIADGKLSHGHLEEITRCDVGWTTGYSLILGGPGTNVSSWECKNRTLNPSPSTCQWSKFFDFPTNASYVGKEEITWHNGTGPVTCDAWTYWTMNQQYKFYTIFNTAIPARSSLIYTANPGYHLYHIDFTDFSAGSPPLEDFNPPKGIHCPNATDYKQEQEQEQEQEQVAQSTTNNVRHLLLPKIKVTTTERERSNRLKSTIDGS